MEHLHDRIVNAHILVENDSLALVLFLDFEEFVLDHVHIENFFAAKLSTQLLYRFILLMHRLVHIVVIVKKLAYDLELLSVDQVDV